MKINYNEIYANVLKCCPLPCQRCAFFKTSVCPKISEFNHTFCGLNGLEKGPGYIFKI